jgi:exonuclease III
MRTLGWNCRGICNASTVRALKALIKVYRPEIIFLCETKAGEDRMEEVKRAIGYSGKFTVSARGKSGGICMLWSNTIELKIMEFNSHFIAVKILEGMSDWHLVGFYGPPHSVRKRETWENLGAVLESIEGSWVCIGDFNMIVEEEEKEGGKPGCASAPNFLKDLIFYLGVVDLGFSGNKFTWTNKRWGKNSIRERLDRGLSNINWRLKFPKAAIYHLGAIKSDHCPILLDTNPSESFTPRPFKFEAAWTRDFKSFEVVDKAWNEEVRGSECFKLCRKQQATKLALKRRNKEEFGLC